MQDALIDEAAGKTNMEIRAAEAVSLVLQSRAPLVAARGSPRVENDTPEKSLQVAMDFVINHQASPQAFAAQFKEGLYAVHAIQEHHAVVGRLREAVEIVIQESPALRGTIEILRQHGGTVYVGGSVVRLGMLLGGIHLVRQRANDVDLLTDLTPDRFGAVVQDLRSSLTATVNQVEGRPHRIEVRDPDNSKELIGITSLPVLASRLREIGNRLGIATDGVDDLPLFLTRFAGYRSEQVVVEISATDGLKIINGNGILSPSEILLENNQAWLWNPQVAHQLEKDEMVRELSLQLWLGVVRDIAWTVEQHWPFPIKGRGVVHPYLAESLGAVVNRDELLDRARPEVARGFSAMIKACQVGNPFLLTKLNGSPIDILFSRTLALAKEFEVTRVNEDDIGRVDIAEERIGKYQERARRLWNLVYGRVFHGGLYTGHETRLPPGVLRTFRRDLLDYRIESPAELFAVEAGILDLTDAQLVKIGSELASSWPHGDQILPFNENDFLELAQTICDRLAPANSVERAAQEIKGSKIWQRLHTE